jgi:hypothetical protein
VATKGRIIEWETGSTAFIASGQLQQQTASAFSSSLSGGYVFAVGGEDFSNSSTMTCAGVLTANGSGQITTGEEDCNEGGTMDHQTGVTGTYTSADSSGRRTGTVVTTHGTSNLAWYVVSASKLLFVGTDAQTSAPVFTGESKSQSGTFSITSLDGVNAFYLSGVSGGTGADTTLGLFTGNFRQRAGGPLR